MSQKEKDEIDHKTNLQTRFNKYISPTTDRLKYQNIADDAIVAGISIEEVDGNE
jgi:hypothetical protein